MKMSTEPVTHSHAVGECPACRDILWAEVDVIAEVDEPTLTREGKAVAYVTARCVAMRLAHTCPTQPGAVFCECENRVIAADLTCLRCGEPVPDEAL